MKKFLTFLFLLLIVGSCDAEKRVARILEKHPEVLTSKMDTIRIPIQVIDSMIITRGDTTFTWYYVRDTIYETYVQKNYIDPSKVKTRQEKRLEAKNERTQIRQDGRTERAEDKQENKTERTKTRKEDKGGNWALWAIIILLSILIGYLLLKRSAGSL